MIQKTNFKVGQKIIDANQILEITKLDDTRLYYKSIDGYHELTGSIPLANVVTAGIRLISSKQEVEEFFKELAKKHELKIDEKPIDQKTFKELMCVNEPLKIVPLLQQLWATKIRMGETFLGGNRDALETIVGHIAEEFAVSMKVKPEEIKTKIVKTLQSVIKVANVGGGDRS